MCRSFVAVGRRLKHLSFHAILPLIKCVSLAADYIILLDDLGRNAIINRCCQACTATCASPRRRACSARNDRRALSLAIKARHDDRPQQQQQQRSGQQLARSPSEVRQTSTNTHHRNKKSCDWTWMVLDKESTYVVLNGKQVRRARAAHAQLMLFSRGVESFS